MAEFIIKNMFAIGAIGMMFAIATAFAVVTSDQSCGWCKNGHPSIGVSGQ